VALGYWQDADPLEALATAGLADALGYRDLWLGEMATFDAFALATAAGQQTQRVELVVGPLAPAVRDAAQLAMGVASVAALVGRPVHLAVGSSSPVVVERWHGRTFAAAPLLRRTVEALRPLLAGEKEPTTGYRLRLPAPAATVTVAAFGPAAVRVASELADRMVINLCTPEHAGRLRGQLDHRVPLAAWIPAAVDPTDEAVEQLRRAVVAYLGAPGYGEMFAAAGFGAVVDVARSGAHPAEILRGVPRELVEAIGLVGDAAACRARMAEHVAAGVDEVVVVPATAGDPGGRRTLSALGPE
jgi:probable F420-dependent oxidoreductase